MTRNYYSSDNRPSLETGCGVLMLIGFIVAALAIVWVVTQ